MQFVLINMESNIFSNFQMTLAECLKGEINLKRHLFPGLSPVLAADLD